MSLPGQIALVWLAGINLIAFALMGVDKWKARHERWRIPERTLFVPALLGGTVGAIAGMRLFHHKTRHWYFRWGLPALLVVQLGLGGWLWLRMNP